MLQRVLREIPKLTDAVVGADIKGEPTYDLATTGAAETTKDAVRKTTRAAKRTARQARKVPGVAQAEGQVKGAVASESDLAIARYDSLTAEEIVGRLASSRRSTWPRSTPTSAATRTATRCSAASARCAPASRGPATTS